MDSKIKVVQPLEMSEEDERILLDQMTAYINKQIIENVMKAVKEK